MKSKILGYIVSIIIVVVALFFIVKYLSATDIIPTLSQYSTSTTQRTTFYDKVLVGAPFGSIRAGLADTEEKRNTGLGGKQNMAPDEGLLFSFETPGINGFWMKEMLFPIDIVWIDANKKVVGVTSEVSPDTYPEAFFPPSSVKYVLEVNSGIASNLGISSGTILVF